LTPVVRVAVLSLHSSPLVQPGMGDSGGMNVYVRELVSSLAHAGADCSVYVRSWRPGLPPVHHVEPGFDVVHVPAGPYRLDKHQLPQVADAFALGVSEHLRRGRPADVLHANYWLSGMAGHRLKHELDLPLVSTFHTLARVKADAGDPEPGRRADIEAGIIDCSDAVLASCTAEAQQLQRYYGADPGRIEVVPPGVDHALFSPGPRRGARAAVGLGSYPVLLFVGRVQPLKGLDVAVEALAAVQRRDTRLEVIGGPSGPDGHAELDRIVGLAHRLDVSDRVRFVAPQPHHVLSTYYRAADVVLVPSRSESFGLVALEAAACAAPVVASSVGGLATLVDPGRTGFLVADRQPTGFATAVDRLLADPVLAMAMGTQAAARARGYSWAGAAGRLRRLFNDLTVRSLVDCVA